MLNAQTKCEYINRLRELQSSLNNYDKEIYKFSAWQNIEESVLDIMLDDAIICRAITSLQEPMASTSFQGKSRGGTDQMTGPVVNFVKNGLKFPQVPLPEFGNLKVQNHRKFFRAFENIMEKNETTHFETFLLLPRQLSGGPRTLIDSIDVDQQ